MFSLRPGILSFSSNQPGSHVAIFGPHGERLAFRRDESHFDDATRSYTWAFEYLGIPEDGDEFVFATTDRTVLGVAENGQITVTTRGASVRRGPEGKPQGLLKPVLPAAVLRSLQGRRTSSAQVLAIFPGVQSPGAGWGSLSHKSANNESAYMAHGMSYISSYLKSRGHKVWLLDTRGFQGWQHFMEEIERQTYDFAMLGPLSIEAFTGACIVRILKEIHPDRPVILGGLHVSMTKDKVFPPDDLPKYYFYRDPPSRMAEFMGLKGEGAFHPERWPKADYVIWNEGELATAAVIEGEDLKAKDFDYEEMPGGTIFLNGKIVPDLNQMPHMDRELFNEEMEKQHPLLPELPAPFHTITFGRGCPYKCSFCFRGGVTQTEYGFEEISDIVRREEPIRIVQANGQLGHAVRFFERPYRGPIVRIRMHYMNQVIEPTPQHKIKIQAINGERNDCAAEKLTLADRLVIPSPHGEQTTFLDIEKLLDEAGENPQRVDDYVRLKGGKTRIPARLAWSDDLLFLIGIYLAEGCVTYSSKRPNSLSMAFCLGMHEQDIIDKINHSMQAIFGVTSGDQQEGRGEIQLWFHSTILGKVFEYLGGPESSKKKLHRWLIGLSDDAFLKIATAWLIGDGNPGVADAFKYMNVTTVSKSLAWGAWTRLLGARVAVSLNKQKRPNDCSIIEGRTVQIQEFYYELNFLFSERSLELGRAAFGEKAKLPSKTTFALEFCEGATLLPIESLEMAYCTDPVFNLEVTPEHTYTINGIGVNNCSVGEQFSSTKVRLIDPDYFMEELHALKRANGGVIGSLMVHDDILLFPKWLASWAEKIKQQFSYIPWWCQMRADFIVNHPDLVRHMAEAGMTWVSVGYEVGHARGLNGIMNKELKVIGLNDPVEINIRASEVLRHNGVNSFGNFMFGNPTETNDEMSATVNMIQRIQPQHHGFSTYCDYPGTALSRLVDAEGLRTQEWYTRTHYPWQYRIKGVDYEHVNRCIQIAAQTPRTYLNPVRAGVSRG